eukprot:3158364-Amphidinium_carterae.1
MEQVVPFNLCEEVPGDIVYLSAGQKCAADSRVLLCTESAMVDSSHVTGRLNDVRVLSKKPTASSVTESHDLSSCSWEEPPMAQGNFS